MEDVLVKFGDLTLPADFLVLDIEKDCEIPIILGRPYLATRNAVINVPKGELSLRVEEKKFTFSFFKALGDPLESNLCNRLDEVKMQFDKKNLVQVTPYPCKGRKVKTKDL